MTISSPTFQRLQDGIKSVDDLRVRGPVNAALAWLSGSLVTQLNTHFGAISQSNSVQIASAISVYDSTRPAFSAHKNGTNQVSISSTVPTKVTFGTEDFDVGGYYASSTYTPLSAGKYFITAAVRWTAASAVDNEQLEISIYKNGVVHKSGLWPRTGASFMQTDVQAVVDANGTTDAFEVYVTKNGAGNGDIQGVDNLTYFQGFKI